MRRSCAACSFLPPCACWVTGSGGCQSPVCSVAHSLTLNNSWWTSLRPVSPRAYRPYRTPGWEVNVHETQELTYAVCVAGPLAGLLRLSRHSLCLYAATAGECFAD